jgi:hypothetical protein
MRLAVECCSTTLLQRLIKCVILRLLILTECKINKIQISDSLTYRISAKRMEGSTAHIVESIYTFKQTTL